MKKPVNTQAEKLLLLFHVLCFHSHVTAAHIDNGGYALYIFWGILFLHSKGLLNICFY